ncbi:hypothetical protein [Robertmurraya massiliosenegalensis]|uniref:hypothetical protein n=1 Tax=Robertmurraya massiliosenegalensis TaxID=1287657 RepID=UPI00036AB8E7|nr:hypothetical protein [Robertmurraya massiliosenegalensis]
MDSPTYRIINIYAQTDKSAESVIVGSRAGLEALSKALELALENGESSCRVAPNDMDTYEIRVLLNNEPIDSPFWSKMKLPYSELDDCCNETVSPKEFLDFGIRNSEDLIRKESLMKKNREISDKIGFYYYVGEKDTNQTDTREQNP